MISQELALQLMEAGYPGIEKSTAHKWSPAEETEYTEIRFCSHCKKKSELRKGYSSLTEYFFYGCPENPELVGLPTLSGLIEACGEDFVGYSLEHYSPERWRCVKWIPHVFQCKDGVNRKGCLWEGENWGFTPEEAVANLWIMLKDSGHGNTPV